MREGAKHATNQRESPGRGEPPSSGGGSNARDHLANERTLLAWARTGVAVMGLGFVVARFGLLIRELGAKLSSHPPTGASSAFGIALVLIGATLLLLATVRYVRVGRAIEASDYRWSPKLAFALAGLLVVAGVVLAAYLLVTA